MRIVRRTRKFKDLDDVGFDAEEFFTPSERATFKKYFDENVLGMIRSLNGRGISAKDFYFENDEKMNEWMNPSDPEMARINKMISDEDEANGVEVTIEIIQ